MKDSYRLTEVVGPRDLMENQLSCSVRFWKYKEILKCTFYLRKNKLADINPPIVHIIKYDVVLIIY